MITTRNEFEVIPAFEVIAGSSQGGWSSREFAVTMLEACVTCTSSLMTDEWEELAGYADDDVEAIDEMIQDAMEHLIYNAPIPESCTIEWRDNEIIVLPFLDDDIPRFEDCPDDHSEDVIYTVNDHGNVTCWQWNPNNVDGNQTGAYESIWDMV